MRTVLFLCSALAAATPYADTQGRFFLSLEDGWELSPRFGETEGMRFSRALPARHGGGRVYFEVEVREDLSAPDWSEVSMSTLERQGHSTHRGASRVGARSAQRVTARRDKHKVRCDYVQAGARAYRLCLEGGARDLRVVNDDVQAMLTSFRAESDGKARPSVKVAPSSGPSAPEGSAVDLSGHYKSEAGVIFELNPRGHFRLGSLEGSYEVQGDLLTLRPDQGKETTFRFSMQAGTLSLLSSRLGAPARYRRIESAGSSSGGGSPVGTWQAGEVKLVLRKDGTFVLGADEGKWECEKDVLRLRKKNGEVVGYTYSLTHGSLRLSGGDLDDPVRFEAHP